MLYYNLLRMYLNLIENTNFLKQPISYQTKLSSSGKQHLSRKLFIDSQIYYSLTEKLVFLSNISFGNRIF